MQIHFTGRNIEITPALKSFTEEKFQRVLRRDESISHVNIVFQIEHVTHVAEATIHIDGIEMHASAQAPDMYVAIDDMIHKLLTQINKHKDKIADHR
jgi:putative sigma-54 modulation protein